MTDRDDERVLPAEERIQVPWSRSARPVPRLVLRPLQAFLEAEEAGGILLLLAAVTALIWANSPWRASYDAVWQTELTFRLGGWSLSEDLRHWVNDALMTLFFLVVGLEIKRELTTGEFREPRVAALPAIAALGGMVVPALLYLSINSSGQAARGWGIPMATDIAFALGVLAIVGRGLPVALKSFLLALAIVDDIGAILVIAVFYSGRIALGPLLAAGGLLALVLVLQRLQVRWTVVYVLLGMGVWLATFRSGIHATIAGVALGFATPAAAFQRPRAVSLEAHRVADHTVDDPVAPDADAHHWLHLAGLTREAVSPLARLEHALHPWTSYVVIPVFAVANAGVSISRSTLGDALAGGVTLGLVAGLVVGKTVGVTVFTWVATRTGTTRLPEGVRWSQLVGVAALAGIGFTVSLFIASLAFQTRALQDSAKVGILAASLLAGLLGALLLARSRRG
ncbi:MAG TPA: Na+/H+ antiporter NhaA [Actinomycetes bacterium]|jgi:NhaA family Na+:H+ antiporter|nr:Na+/H+ antiporter NhaA [Actinomycetes bacterium]